MGSSTTGRTTSTTPGGDPPSTTSSKMKKLTTVPLANTPRWAFRKDNNFLDNCIEITKYLLIWSLGSEQTLFTSRARQLIRNHAIKEKERPLFLYVAYQNIHGPLTVPPRFLKGRYEPKNRRELATGEHSSDVSSLNVINHFSIQPPSVPWMRALEK